MSMSLSYYVEVIKNDKPPPAGDRARDARNAEESDAARPMSVMTS